MMGAFLRRCGFYLRLWPVRMNNWQLDNKVFGSFFCSLTPCLESI